MRYPDQSLHMDKKTQNPPNNKERLLNEDKYRKLVEYMKQLQLSSFTGYIKINYSQGSVGRIEKFEEILKK